MGVVNLKGSRVITNLLAAVRSLASPGLAGGKVRVWSETVEVGAADSATSTYHMARLPSNARLLGLSRVWWDDLASTGAPTLDIGIFPINSEFTEDPDAINDGMDAATANITVGQTVVKDPARMGKRLWELINGVTVDPKCEVDVKISLVDADVNVGGTITAELLYTLD
jgi:hypothetical protein